MRLPFVVVVGLAFTVTACFSLQRADELPPGVVIGLVVDSDGAAVPGANVLVVGLGQRVRADKDGRFRVERISVGGHAFLITSDDDDDGVAELGTLRTVLLPKDDGTGRAVGVDLGPVVAVPTGSISGRVVDDAGAAVGAATVALWRNVDLGLEGAAPLRIDLAAERVVQTRPDGAFSIAGLVVGAAQFASFDSVADVVTRGSLPDDVTIPPGTDRDVGDVALVALQGTRKARITFVDDVDEVLEIRISPAGAPPPLLPTLTRDGTADVVIDIPFGVWDLAFAAGTRRGVLQGQVAPPLGPEEVSWGLVELSEPLAPPACGDGTVDPGELCDDGEDGNSDTAVDACRTTCVPAGCGDGVIDAGESCDDGDGNSDSAADACRTTCEPAGCGDAVTDTGEGCDDGEGNSDAAVDACRSSCAPPSCGDDVTDTGEGCDDGEGNSDADADACRSSCAPANCGDGVTDTGEACDDGDDNSDTTADACRATCAPARCGDGVTDTGEGCDDGVDNASSCEPVGDSGCGFCDADACLPVSVPSEATLVFQVNSVQGWGINPLGGVPVSVAGVTIFTDDDGVASVTVPLPRAAGELAIIGDSRDERFIDRAFTRTAVSLPLGLVHAQTAPVPVQLLEGCALTSSGVEEQALSNTCPNLHQELRWQASANSLFAVGTTTPLTETDTYELRVTALPDGVFDDPTVTFGFPETKTTDGRLLRCAELFDVHVDGADLNPVPAEAVRLIPSSEGTFEAFFFDEALGGFVSNPEMTANGDIRLVREGTWCLGEALPVNACVTLAVDDVEGAAVSGDVVVDVVDASGGVIRARSVIAEGGTTCVPFAADTFPVVVATASDGRQDRRFIEQVSASENLCGAATEECSFAFVAFSEEPFAGCVDVNIEMYVTQQELINPFPPSAPVVIEEQRELSFYRGRLLFTVDERRRCLLVPNEVNSLNYVNVSFGEDCDFGESFSQSNSAFRNDFDPFGAPVCSDLGACDVSLGDVDFFCGS